MEDVYKTDSKQAFLSETKLEAKWNYLVRLVFNSFFVVSHNYDFFCYIYRKNTEKYLLCVF